MQSMVWKPDVTVAAVIERDGQFLFVDERASGRIVINQPAGHLERGETFLEAAARETLEEACARVEIGDLFSLINVPHISQVHLVYRARLMDLEFAPGAESLEVALFAEKDIPWDAIAFRSIAMTLQYFYDDRRSGGYRLHVGDVIVGSRQPRE